MRFLQRILIATMLVLGFSVSTIAQADDECRGTTPLIINDVTAQVELALKERERRYGLMFRSSMGENCGMLFVFPQSRTRVFTMRNTLIPLDIAFIDEEGRIAEIFSMQPGGDRYPSSVAARYALEMNKGWFAANNIGVNDKIETPDSAGELMPLDSLTKE